MTILEVHKTTGVSVSKITAFTKIHPLKRDMSQKNHPLKWTDKDLHALKLFASQPTAKKTDPYIYLFYIVRRYSGKEYYEKFIGRYPLAERKIVMSFCKSQRQLMYEFAKKWKNPKYVEKIERVKSPEEVRAFIKKNTKEMYTVYTTAHRAMFRIKRVISYEHEQFWTESSVDNSSVSVHHSDLPQIYKNTRYFGMYRRNRAEWNEYITKQFLEKPPLLSVEEMEQYIVSGARYDGAL